MINTEYEDRACHLSHRETATSIPGYTFDQAPDLSDEAVRQKLIPNAIRLFTDIVKKWALTEEQARALLGGIASSTYHGWRTNPKNKKLDQDTLMRISLIIGIYKGLHLYFGDSVADRSITRETEAISSLAEHLRVHDSRRTARHGRRTPSHRLLARRPGLKQNSRRPPLTPDRHIASSPRYTASHGHVLASIADDEAMLQDAILLEGASNEQIQAELHGLTGIGIHELVFAIPHSQIINAAFTHAAPAGSRFNDNQRGAWYAAITQSVAIEEIMFHKARNLADMIDRQKHESFTYVDWVANFRADFHALLPREDYEEFLEPGPIPACYARSQALANQLLSQGSPGILYPSVRAEPTVKNPRCIACFRPALVQNVREDRSFEISFTLSGTTYLGTVTRLN